MRAEQNLVNLIKLLIDGGSEPNVSEWDEINDIFKAIKIKSVKIIELICSRFAIDLDDYSYHIHYNFYNNCQNPLTLAVLDDIEIVKIVHKYGAGPCVDIIHNAILCSEPLCGGML